MKKVLVNIPERKYVPTLGMGPHRMVYLRSDLVRPLRAYGLIIQVLKEERRKLHVDVPTERKVETETVANQPTTTVSAQPTTTAPPVQPTFETPKTDVPVNNTPEFTGGVNGTEAAVSKTEEAPSPAVEEKPEEQPQPSATETPSPAVEEHHEEVAPVVSQPETVVEAPKTETTSEVAHVEGAAAPVSQPVAEEHHEEAPSPAVEEHHEEAPTPAVEEKHEEAPVAEPTHATEEVPSPVVETTHVEETHADEQPHPAVEEKHEEAPVASQPEVAPAATEGTPTVEETNEVPDTEVTTEPVAAAGTYSTTTGRTIEISEEEYALLSREGVTKQELKDLLNAKGFRTLYRDTLKDLFAKFGIEY